MELGTVTRVDIEEKMRAAYLSYAMSVITARALPDVRDGLKPVQRRILYAMYNMGLRHDQPTRKSARIVGEVLGKYHPHGDKAVYDAMVRMAQDFSSRYPLVDGQGNFGSVDGDQPAAIRYTEARLSALGEEMLGDLDKDTVDFWPNFDDSLQEPTVLPAKLPNLLVNGAGGIAVGMATNIPPHNLSEVADAIAYLIDQYDRQEDVSLDELMQYIKGPDFPTGGIIMGSEGIRQAYATGKGRIVVRAQLHKEVLSGGRDAIIVTELPYQVNKATLIERIAHLVREGQIEGIGDLRDESDRTGMRIVIELKRGVEWEPIVKYLFSHSQLQNTFGAIMLALVDGEPRMLPLKRILLHYVNHRLQVIERRTRYELAQAEDRAHVLEGLLKALDQLDAVIETIRRSRTAETARKNLCKRFGFTQRQATAILDMQLRRLAALERRRIQKEHVETIKRIAYLRDLLSDRHKILSLIKTDILDLKQNFGDPRRTRISSAAADEALLARELVPNERLVALVHQEGTIGQTPLQAFTNTDQRQNFVTAGQGITAASIVGAQDRVLFISESGDAFAFPAHQLPDERQQANGLPLEQLVGTTAKIVAMLPLTEQAKFLCLATREGKIKRLARDEFSTLTRTSTPIITLSKTDRLVAATLSQGEEDLLMVTALGKAIRFAQSDVRPQGRRASGMRGIALRAGDYVIGLSLAVKSAEALIVTEAGFAKRSSLSEYKTQGRGGQGMTTVDESKFPISGAIVRVATVQPMDTILITSRKGQVAILSVDEIPRTKRASWGRIVTRTRRRAVIQLGKDDTVTAMSVLSFDSTESDTPKASKQSRSKARPTRRKRSSAARSKSTQNKAKAHKTEAPDKEESQTSNRPVRRRGAVRKRAPVRRTPRRR